MKYYKMKKSILLIFTFINTNLIAMELKTEITIQASPEKVWSILTNFNEYPNWNPFIKSIQGDMIIGQQFKARIEPPNAKGMNFEPVLLEFKKNTEFRWKGKLFINGLFDGEHQFLLIENADGSTTLIQSEKFNGILVPLFKKMIDVNTRNGFMAMNEKLKELAEK